MSDEHVHIWMPSAVASRDWECSCGAEAWGERPRSSDAAVGLVDAFAAGLKEHFAEHHGMILRDYGGPLHECPDIGEAIDAYLAEFKGKR